MSTLLKSNATVAVGTALSRITGLVRVSVLGIVLGQSALTDAYNQANGTPNMVYELVLGGVLSASLVPLFTRLKEDNDRQGTQAVISVAALGMAVLTAIAVLAAPLIFRLYSLVTSATVDGAQYRAVGTALSRIFLIQIFFYGLNALGGAALNARRRFFAAAWTPALSNLIIIASLLAVPRTVDGRLPVLDDVLTNSSLRWTLGLGATFGIATMALGLIPAMIRADVPLSFRPDFRHPAVAKLRSLSGWAFGYVIANQVALIVVQNLLIRSGEGGKTAYTNAFTWFVLPHGLLAVSIATTFVPEMASAVKRRDKAALINRTSLGIRLIAMCTMPAAFGLFVLRRAVVGAAFQHGRFTEADALLTSRALGGLALGLAGFSTYLFILRAFYAHQDARTPFVINVFENLINVILAIALVDRFGVLGLGVSFAVAYVLSSLWALQILSMKVPGFPVRTVLASLWRTTLASVIMAEVVWLVARHVGANVGSGAFVRTITGAIVGTCTYLVVLRLLGSTEIHDFIQRLRPSRAVSTAK